MKLIKCSLMNLTIYLFSKLRQLVNYSLPLVLTLVTDKAFKQYCGGFTGERCQLELVCVVGHN